MRLSVISNENLNPWINWSTLGPPLLRALAKLPGVEHLAPLPLGSRGNLLNTLALYRKAMGSNSIFWMQMSARPEPAVWLISIFGGRVTRAAFVVDAWPGSLSKIGALARIQRLNPCFIAFKQAQEVLSDRFPNSHFEWLPFGIDSSVFYPREHPKDIDIYWMGRRYGPLHEALLTFCAGNGLVYEYTKKSGEISDPSELGDKVSRARYFVVTPPDLDNPLRTGEFSPLVMRYMEGIAAGTRLLGVLPSSGEYEMLLPANAILQVKPDGSDLGSKLMKDYHNSRNYAYLRHMSDQVISAHSWKTRARQIYNRMTSDQTWRYSP